MVSHQLIKYAIVLLKDYAISYQTHAVQYRSDEDVKEMLFDILERMKRVTIRQ